MVLDNLKFSLDTCKPISFRLRFSKYIFIFVLQIKVQDANEVLQDSGSEVREEHFMPNDILVIKL